MNKTTSYYNSKAHEFFSETKDIEMVELYKPFLKLIPEGGSILDAGCGSGRDVKNFMAMGYQVTAFDASIELCKLASKESGIEVSYSTFEEFKTNQKYDGIWACASLLHLSKHDLKTVFKKYAQYLKPTGIFYCSFKYGEFEGDRNGRVFTDLTEQGLSVILSGSGLEILNNWITSDLRPGRENEKWLNSILRRVN